MDKLLKALIAFVALTISLSTSLPKNGNIVEIINNSPEFTTEYASDFYHKKKWERQVMDPVVKINLIARDGEERIAIASGTGFGVAYNPSTGISYVITNMHICQMPSQIPIQTDFYFEDSERIMGASEINLMGKLTPIKWDEDKDLCLMITDKYIRPAKIAKSNYEVNQMERVKIIGAPNGVFPIILDSYISNIISRDIMGVDRGGNRPFYLISEIVFSGQSGSPVYNSNREVIGVVFMNLNNEFGPIYGTAAIPLGDIIEFLDTSGINQD